MFMWLRKVILLALNELGEVFGNDGQRAAVLSKARSRSPLSKLRVLCANFSDAQNVLVARRRATATECVKAFSQASFCEHAYVRDHCFLDQKESGWWGN